LFFHRDLNFTGAAHLDALADINDQRPRVLIGIPGKPRAQGHGG
tara:strand:- start:21 stop:152 length:132 start_codon:yes stop_codon:yes gene_type:complete